MNLQKDFLAITTRVLSKIAAAASAVSLPSMTRKILIMTGKVSLLMLYKLAIVAIVAIVIVVIVIRW
jgi:hypothetical protein